MRVDRELLIRFLRQQGELGGTDLMLDSLTAAELVGLLRTRPRPPVAAEGGSATAAATASPSGGDRPAEALVDDSAAALGMPRHDEDGVGSGRAPLHVMAAEAAGCTRCGLSEGRRNVVFGVGNPAAEVVVVGEAPGAEEDRTGLPFVGRAGKLLDLLLLSAGFPREKVYICNVLKCRPPNNRDPQRDEVAACSSYLHGQLEAIGPRVLVAVGKFAAQTLVGTEESIGKLRGRVHAYRGVPLVATYHPAFLLRSPQWMRAAWQDIQLVREVLEADAV